MEEVSVIKTKKYLIVVIMAMCLFFLLFLYATEKYIMPIAADLCGAKAKEVANYMINSAVKAVLSEGNITADDILMSKTENDMTMLFTDTVKVNMLCADISEYINKETENMGNNKVSIPYGAATGIGIMANRGPKISFEVKPAGDAEVDYATEFVSAGINQTNYKIWLTVNITVSLVNPMYNRKINMTRKLMLADTVIKGEVPLNYLTIPQN